MSKTMNIIRELAKQLKSIDEIVEDKIIFFKRDLTIIQNCYHIINE